MSIPAGIDHLEIIRELESWGWKGTKIECACGFSNGYVSQLKCGNITEMGYNKAARLFNLWESEKDLQTRTTGT